jgi:alpha-tubulin suppressor-like RCC1 family protein
MYQFFLNGNPTGAPTTNNFFVLNNPADGDLVGLIGISNITGCSQSIGPPYYVQVENIPQISAIGNTTFCEGDSVLLTINDSIAVQWQNSGVEIDGALQNFYFAYEGGNYTAEVQQGGIGTVWAIGSNASGQLGDSSTTNSSSPVLSRSIEQIISIESGDNFVIALDDSGKVYTWGNNQFGQLGDGTFTNRTLPILNGAINGAQAVAAGSNHSIVLLSSGNLLSFGNNSDGQLGIGNNNTTNFPQNISTLNNVLKIASGEKHSLALLNDSTVWAWGDNQYGQLGDGTFSDRRRESEENQIFDL